MKRICIASLLLFASLAAIGQTSFSRLYWKYPYVGFGAAVNYDENYIYIVGRGNSYWDGFLAANRFFIKSDYFGDPISTSYIFRDSIGVWYGGYTSGLGFISDSILVCAGYFSRYDTLFHPWNSQHLGVLYKYNISGDTVLTKKYFGDGYTEFERIVRNDGEITLGGYTSDTTFDGVYGYLIRVEENGLVLNETKCGDGIYDEISGLMDFNGNDRLLAGGVIDETGSDLISINNGIIHKIDNLGNLYFSKEIGTPGNDSEVEVKVAKNGQSYIVRQYIDTVINEGDYEYVQYIGKTDTNVNFIWRTFLNDEFYKYIYTLRTFEDGSIVAVGVTIVDNTYEPHGYIVKLDSNGTVLWERDHTNNPAGNHYLYDFQKMPDGGYICSGMGADTVEGGGIESMCWLLRLDSMGCLIPGCDEVSVPDIAVNSETYLSIYPNPFGDAATVEVHLPQDFNINGNQSLRFDIYDMQGRLIDNYSNIYPSNPGETIRFKMYRNKMTVGNYLATLKYGDEVLNTIQFVIN